MGWWAEQVVPRVADRALGLAAVREPRRRVCSQLSGDVVEIGFGSGHNVEHYPGEVAGVWAVEPSDVAWAIAQRRSGGSPAPVVRAGLDGQRLDLPDDRFDSALSTFTLCTIPDVDAALAELRRVLRPGSSFHFLEHGRSPEESVARWQDRLTPVQRRLSGGCSLNRRIGDVIESCGLVVEELDTFYIEGPRPFAYAYLGRARNPA